MGNNTLRTPFILLEGMDLAGKSTILAELKKSFRNWKSNHLSLGDNKKIYSITNRVSKSGICSKEEIGFLYCAGLNMEIDSFSWPKLPTFQDSCVLLRALAHHSAYGNRDLVFMLEELGEKHPKFSKAFVFTVSMSERFKRLQKRQIEEPDRVDNSDRLILDSPDTFLKMDQAIINYSKKYFGAEVINTETFPLAETAAMLHRELSSLLLLA